MRLHWTARVLLVAMGAALSTSCSGGIAAGMAGFADRAHGVFEVAWQRGKFCGTQPDAECVDCGADGDGGGAAGCGRSADSQLYQGGETSTQASRNRR